MPYTRVPSTLNDDILLCVFNFYRIVDEKSWNFRLGWCKLSHVCRRWRNLIYDSAFHLDMQILCTNGTPVVDTLDHLPSLPLVIDYQDVTSTLSAKDEFGMSQALRFHNRIRRAAFNIPPTILHRLLLLMDDTFPILEQLCLSSTVKDVDAGLILPTNLMAPNMCHLTLRGIGLPTGLPLLSSTFSLVTLTLADIPTSGYFLPKDLVPRLRFLPQLEELSISFSILIPRPSAEGELLGTLEGPVTIPALKHLTFRGVSAYLESLVAQFSAPLLEHLSITIFNQVAIALPHLSRFTNTTEKIKLPIASIVFDSDTVSVITTEHGQQQRADGTPSFSFRVMCRTFDWQVDCAAQICNALMPMISGVEELMLDIDGQRTPTDWRDYAVDGMSWREILVPFVGARELHIGHALAWELSFALQEEDAGLDPMLLPGLQKLSPLLEAEHANYAFSSFADARQIAGRPVRVSPCLVSQAQPGISEQHDPPNADLTSHPRSTLRSWFREKVIGTIRSRLR